MAKVALIYNLKKTKDKTLPQDYCSEFDSQETINTIAQAITDGGHDVYPVEAAVHLLDWLRCNKIDIAFNAAEGIHGQSRESQVPAILDFLGIPYTGSGVLACALSLDKTMAKRIFMQNGLPTPKFQLFKKENEKLKQNLLFPLIVKPNCEGSAKGIHASSVVHSYSQLYKEISGVRQLYRQDVLVEEFIEGREITVGILGNEDIRSLPLLEIDFSNCKTQGEYFYSWEVKEYQGIDPAYPDPEFFCPARLTAEEENAVRKVAQEAHQALGCFDLSRVDIRLSPESIPYLLEVNPLPGLDPQESNLTKMLKACNLSYSELINEIIETALKRYNICSEACKVKT